MDSQNSKSNDSVNNLGRREWAFIGQFFLIFIGPALILAGIWAVRPYFESQTFNRLTGANTTYWDALWVDLRVDCQNFKK